MANLLDGKSFAAETRSRIKSVVDGFRATGQLVPGLAVILVGEDPASQVYVTSKKKACQEAGFQSLEIRLPAGVSVDELLAQVQKLNENPLIHGILVQLPLPKHIDQERILAAVHPAKDVDGFHPSNLGKLLIGTETFVPCTPLGILELLKHHQIPFSGRKALVIGRSTIVGKPMALLLMGENATVTIAHSRTRDLEQVVRESEILVVAMGKPQFIPGSWIREGAVVVDVGIHRIGDATGSKGSRLVGDVDFEAAAQRAGWITPVPGGVGPMTIATLLSNTLKARNMQMGSTPSSAHHAS